MGLLRRLLGGELKDPVPGEVKVISASAHPGRGVREICDMSLVVQAEGVEPTAIDLSPLIHRDRWPDTGMTIPAVVDRANPKNVVIKFDAIPAKRDRRRAEAEAAASEMRRDG